MQIVRNSLLYFHLIINTQIASVVENATALGQKKELVDTNDTACPDATILVVQEKNLVGSHLNTEHMRANCIEERALADKLSHEQVDAALDDIIAKKLDSGREMCLAKDEHANTLSVTSEKSNRYGS